MEDSSDIFSIENIRNNWLKFFEDLFRHVLQETEGIESTTGYDLKPVVKKFERFVCKSGLVPSSENESDDDYELSLALAASLDHYADTRSESTSGSASAAPECATASGSESRPSSLSKSTSVSGFASESASTSTSEYASGSASSSEYASVPGSASSSEYASVSGSASEYASGSASASEYASTSGSATSSGYAPGEELTFNFSDLFNSYDRNLGFSIHRVLAEVAGEDIDKFYQSVKEKIIIKEDLKLFLERLTNKFLHSTPQLEMYFLAIVSRVFSLLYKTGEINPKIFIEAVTDTIFDGEMELQLASSMNTHELVSQILRDSKDWIREFRDLKCGDASEYFSS